MFQLPDRLKPGETRDLRGWLNALRDFARRGRVTVAEGSGLSAEEGPGGTVIGLTRYWEGYIRLTGRSGAAYAWTMVTHVSGTTWQDLAGPGASGTTAADPAYEATAGSTTIDTSTSPRVWARRDRDSGAMVFELGDCP